MSGPLSPGPVEVTTNPKRGILTKRRASAGLLDAQPRAASTQADQGRMCAWTHTGQNGAWCFVLGHSVVME